MVLECLADLESTPLGPYMRCRGVQLMSELERLQMFSADVRGEFNVVLAKANAERVINFCQYCC